MNIFKTKKSGPDPRDELRNVDTTLQLLYVNTLAARELLAKKEEEIFQFAKNRMSVGGRQLCEGPESAVSNAIGEVFQLCQPNHIGVQFAAAKEVCATLENSAEFKRAKEIIEPLLAAIAEQDKAEEAKRFKAQRQVEEARAEVESHLTKPELLTAKEKLATAEKERDQLHGVQSAVDPWESKLSDFERQLETGNYDFVNGKFYEVQGLIDRIRAAVADKGTRAINSDENVVRAERLFLKWKFKLKSLIPKNAMP